MDYEKKYKEALERAQQAIDRGQVSQNFVDDIFPEHKGSRDERIRNFLFDFIKICTWTEKKNQGWPSREDCLAWLEKQGEKKNTCKREIDDAYLQDICDAKHEIEKQGEKKSSDEILKIRQELYQSGYNDGYKHGQMDYAYNSNRETALSVKLDANKVIEWLNEYVADFWNSPCNPNRVVYQFKKDFRL